MKRFAGFALALLATPAVACPLDAAQLFVCGTGEMTNEGYLEMCDLTGEGDATDRLQFEMQVAGGKQLRFPADAVDSKQSFFFSNTDGDDGYLVDMRFSAGGKDFRLYSLAIPPEGENDAGGGAAGLVITAPDGSQEHIACSERPYMFISYLRDSMSCDRDNPLGEAACDPANVPDRTAPLGEESGAPIFRAD